MAENTTYSNDGGIEAGTSSSVGGELAPLLHTSPSETSLEIAKRDTCEAYPVVASKELYWIATSAIKTASMLLVVSSFRFVNFVSVSHLGATEITAMSLGITFSSFFGMAPISGLVSAMDTFCSNAFTASRNKTLVGFHFQRGIIAIFIHLAIISPIMWHLDKLFLLLGQDPEVVELCILYIRVNLLGSVPLGMFEASTCFLQAQGIMSAGTTVSVIVAPIHLLLNFFLVRSPTYGVGFVGAPIATTLASWMLFIGILIYIRFSRAAEAWGGWDHRALHNMSEYYRLAIPSIIAVNSKWLGFDFVTLVGSYFGAHKLAAQSIILTYITQFSRISEGLGIAASPRVGNLIGAGMPRQACIASDMTVTSSAIVGMLGALTMIIFKAKWIPFFTPDGNVAQEVLALIPVSCIYIISEGFNEVLSPILRGLGRQKASANVYILGSLFIVLPVGYYLGIFLGMETSGLLWSIVCSSLAANIFQFIYIYKWIDWKDEVSLCLIRLRRSNGEQDNEASASI